MAKPALTAEQRQLLDYVNREKLGPGQEIDTVRYPALGDQPAHETVEFRPSLVQRAKDAVGSARGALRGASAHMPSGDDIAEVLSGLSPFARANKMAPPETAGRPLSLRDVIAPMSAKGLLDHVLGAKFDATTTNGTPKKPTKLQKDGL